MDPLRTSYEIPEFTQQWDSVLNTSGIDFVTLESLVNGKDIEIVCPATGIQRIQDSVSQ